MTQTVTIDPAKNGGARAEVAVKGVTGGTVMLTPGAPGGGTYCDIEVRYALGRGDSGIYAYAIFSHPAAYGAMGVGESRYITKLNQTFDWISVDADRNMLECTPQDWGAGVVVHAKEQRILSTGFYKNSVEHKYSYNAVQYKIPGLRLVEHQGTRRRLVHQPDHRIPQRRRLQAGTGLPFRRQRQPRPDHPGLLARHALRRRRELQHRRRRRVEQGHRPDLRLLQRAGRPQSPLPGRPRHAGRHRRQPHRAARLEGQRHRSVAGRARPGQEREGPVALRLGQRRGLPAQGRARERHRATRAQRSAGRHDQLPNLTVGLAHPDYAGGGGGGEGGRWRRWRRRMVDWAHDAKFYQFWNDGSEDGKFTITNVRPGTYTLHAFADGVLGEFARPTSPSRRARPSTWASLNGSPCATANKSGKSATRTAPAANSTRATATNYWLWGWCLRYGALFPNDITYTIGKSDYHKDWFFEQVPHELSDAWKNPDAKDPLNQRFGWVKAATAGEDTVAHHSAGAGRPPGPSNSTWTRLRKGQAALRVALAGADGDGGLAVAVNGQSVGTIRPDGHQRPPLQHQQERLAGTHAEVRRRAAEAGRKRNAAHRPCRGTHDRRRLRLPALGTQRK